MPELIRVGMADYKVGSAPATIISYGLGSCIGISIYDPQTKIGGLLHIMLPDSTQSRPSENPAKFADTGIPLMLADILQLGASRSRLVAKLAGGAQMFAFANATDIMRVGARNAVGAAVMDTGGCACALIVRVAGVAATVPARLDQDTESRSWPAPVRGSV